MLVCILLEEMKKFGTGSEGSFTGLKSDGEGNKNEIRCSDVRGSPATAIYSASKEIKTAVGPSGLGHLLGSSRGTAIGLDVKNTTRFV